MAGTYSAGTVSVGTTATLITTVTDGGNVLVQNAGTAAVYVGPATVTTTNGFPVAASSTVTIPALDDQTRPLYGVVASGTASVSFIQPV